MDRFSWIVGNRQLKSGEQQVIQQHGVRIYDGENKVSNEVIVVFWYIYTIYIHIILY